MAGTMRCSLLVIIILLISTVSGVIEISFEKGVPRLNNSLYCDYYFACHTEGETLQWRVGNNVFNYSGQSTIGNVLVGSVSDCNYTATLLSLKPLSSSRSFTSALILTCQSNFNMPIICSDGSFLKTISIPEKELSLMAETTNNSIYLEHVLSQNLVNADNSTCTNVFVCGVNSSSMDVQLGNDAFLLFTEFQSIGNERTKLQGTSVLHQAILINKEPYSLVVAMFIVGSEVMNVTCGFSQNRISLSGMQCRPITTIPETTGTMESDSSTVGESSTMASENDNSLPLILGPSITFGVLLLVAVVVIIIIGFCFRQYKKREGVRPEAGKGVGLKAMEDAEAGTEELERERAELKKQRKLFEEEKERERAELKKERECAELEIERERAELKNQRSLQPEPETREEEEAETGEQLPYDPDSDKKFNYTDNCSSQMSNCPELLSLESSLEFGLNFTEVHKNGINGEGIKVAIIDSYDTRNQKSGGVQKSHKAWNEKWNIVDLTDDDDRKEFKRDNYDNQKMRANHALRCASILAGQKFDKAYFCVERLMDTYIFEVIPHYPGGVAPNAEVTLFLMNVRTQSVVRAFEAVRDSPIQFDVLSMSYGWCFDSIKDKDHQTIKSIRACIDDIRDKNPNIIIVAAAGNNGNWSEVGYPAKFENVISVGSLDMHFKKCPSSPEGPNVDIYYCGEVVTPIGDSQLLARHNNRQLSFGNGTAMAAPGIAGIICLFLDIHKKAEEERHAAEEERHAAEEERHAAEEERHATEEERHAAEEERHAAEEERHAAEIGNGNSLLPKNTFNIREKENILKLLRKVIITNEDSCLSHNERFLIDAKKKWYDTIANL